LHKSGRSPVLIIQIENNSFFCLWQNQNIKNHYIAPRFSQNENEFLKLEKMNKYARSNLLIFTGLSSAQIKAQILVRVDKSYCEGFCVSLND
jgi:hypothetical protein